MFRHFGEGNMPALLAADATAVQTCRQNNANEPKRPPLDAGDLSQPTPSPDVGTWDDYYLGHAPPLQRGKQNYVIL